MKNKTHDAESFCRQTLLRNPQALEDAQKFYDGRAQFGDEWPDWCDLPMAATYAILTQGASVAHAPTVLAAGAGILELSALTAALVWTKTKIVYRFDETLLGELKEQPLDGNIPQEILFRMPYPCVFVECDFKFGQSRATGFFAWMEYDINNKMPELRLLYLLKSGYSISVAIILTGGTLDDSFAALLASGLARAMALPTLPMEEYSACGPSREDISAAINLLLYLCADNPDMPDATTLRARRSKDARGHAKRTVQWDVGTRIGAALRRAYQVAQEQQSVPSVSYAVRSPSRPHIRRAHWHHFWTGPRDGDRKLVVKWLPPISVNLDDSALPTVIYPLKR